MCLIFLLGPLHFLSITFYQSLQHLKFSSLSFFQSHFRPLWEYCCHLFSSSCLTYALLYVSLYSLSHRRLVPFTFILSFTGRLFCLFLFLQHFPSPPPSSSPFYSYFYLIFASPRVLYIPLRLLSVFQSFLAHPVGGEFAWVSLLP